MKFQEAASLSRTASQSPISGRTPRRHAERGTIILLVAIVMLFVVGAMAALSIDVVTLYSARSEAQLVADSTALAFARVIANSGATSDSTGNSMAAAWTTATTFATQIAYQNQIAGITLAASNSTLTFTPATAPSGTPNSNPTITVTIQISTLPTFFARIWGTTTFTVAASATAEVYNPSVAPTGPNASRPPIAPLCVKPWLLPNIDPSSPTGAPIFVTGTGAINTTTLLGWNSVTNGNPTNGNPVYLQPDCPPRNCNFAVLPAQSAWRFYPGDPNTTFPTPTVSVPSCTNPLRSNYEVSVAGCIQVPIACNGQANIDTTDNINWARETDHAVNCLIHAVDGPDADKIDSNYASAPFEFVAGSESGNPAASVAGYDIMVSDSLVTVPVFDNGTGSTNSTNNQIVGFVQLFLNPDGGQAPEGGTNGQVNTTVINLAGCGTSGATGNPIIGNGATAVAVRLISPSAPSP